MTEKNHETTFSVTPGQLLLAAREARSLSQADIAKRMHLSVQAIRSIEQDDYAQIGVRTYVRGYLSTYARLVSISEKQILDALDASGLMAADTHSVLPRIEGAPVMNVTHQRLHKLNSRWIMTAGAGVLVLVVLISWLHTPKEDAVKNTQAKNQTSLLSLEQPVVVSTPTVAVTQPVVAPAPTVEKNKKHKHASKAKENKKMAENAFVIRPAQKLHTTYKITPAT